MWIRIRIRIRSTVSESCFKSGLDLYPGRRDPDPVPGGPEIGTKCTKQRADPIPR
jgi:hypothetical protein